jgi:hypothetical protein
MSWLFFPETDDSFSSPNSEFYTLIVCEWRFLSQSIRFKLNDHTWQLISRTSLRINQRQRDEKNEETQLLYEGRQWDPASNLRLIRRQVSQMLFPSSPPSFLPSSSPSKVIDLHEHSFCHDMTKECENNGFPFAQAGLSFLFNRSNRGCARHQSTCGCFTFSHYSLKETMLQRSDQRKTVHKYKRSERMPSSKLNKLSSLPITVNLWVCRKIGTDTIHVIFALEQDLSIAMMTRRYEFQIAGETPVCSFYACKTSLLI